MDERIAVPLRPDPDDVVLVATAPADVAFGRQLSTAVRRESPPPARDQAARPDPATVPLGAADRCALRAAYAALPERWRTVLWQLDVEGRTVHEVAAQLGVAARSVPALVYRARSALREGFLQHRMDAVAGDPHAGTRSLLDAVLRRTASARQQELVMTHLAGCEACMDVYLDLRDVEPGRA